MPEELSGAGRMWPLLLILLILLSVLAPTLFWRSKIVEVSKRFPGECTSAEGPPAEAPSEAPDGGISPASAAGDIREGETQRADTASPDWSRAVPHLKDQSALLLNWALLLITGSVAVIVTSQMHGFRSLRVIYFLLAPMLAMLGSSCFAALMFESRLAYVEFAGCTATAGTLTELLRIQVQAFLFGICLAASIGVVCLTEVAAGYVNPGGQR